MFDFTRRLVLRAARLPADPSPPAGAPGSIKIFRAASNYYKLRVARWFFAQIGAVIGIMISLWFLDQLDGGVTEFRAIATENAPARQVAAEDAAPDNEAQKVARKKQRKDIDDLARKVAAWPDWTLRLIHWAEYAAIALFILQLPVTFAAVRLEFEQHWYIVTDRSLRIRTGLLSLQESTMSFANLQQVEVRQRPLQRLLGIADVRVQSAGGGGDSEHKSKGQDSMHHAIFHGVTNAGEIRDLILARLKRFREAGLGDPDDSAPLAENNTALAAAQELLAEVRTLRQTFRP